MLVSPVRRRRDQPHSPGHEPDLSSPKWVIAGHPAGGDQRGVSKLLLENVVEIRKWIELDREALGSWQPHAHQTRKIVLDFDSGHYAPRSAWLASEVAWMMAGYEP